MMRLTSVTDDQLCFLFGGRKVTISIKDFAIITGLNCEPLKYYFANSNRDTKFKKTYFPNDSKLKVDNVRSIFMLAQNISDKDPIKLANLYFREAILLTKEPNTFIDMDHVS